MRLFISYSRDDKLYVYTLEAELRTDYALWIDKQIVGGTQWWKTILDEIDKCDIFIACLSPRAVESIYCRAELNYAIDCGKPILPMQLKPCVYPERLEHMQVQYIDVSNISDIQRVLRICERAIGNLNLEIERGKFPLRIPKPPHPSVPSAQQGDSVDDVFAAAAEATAANDYGLAQKLFQQVIDVDQDGLGIVATLRLQEIRSIIERDKMYGNIIRLMARDLTERDAKAMWDIYVKKYGRDYDPNNLAENLDNTPNLDTHSVPFPRFPTTPKPLKYQVGQHVKHDKFGEGEVIGSRRSGDDEEISVRFEKIGIKTLIASLARLTILKPLKYRSGQRVKHDKFGEGVVIASRRSGDEEEISVRFEKVGMRTLIASLARLTTIKN